MLRGAILGSNRTRGVIELIAAVTLLVLSTVIFGWATWGWWEPKVGPGDYTYIPSLMLYTNNTTAVTGDLAFKLGDDGKVFATLHLEIPSSDDTPRWALVGRGDMFFELYDNEKQTVMKDVAPGELTKHCGEDRGAGAHESVLVGDTVHAHQIGGEDVGAMVVAGSFLGIELYFPNLTIQKSGEQYSISIGPLGRPGENDWQHIAGMTLSSYPECIHIAPPEEALNSGDLKVANMRWESVRVPPVESADTLQLADPPPTEAGVAGWRVTDFASLKATYTAHNLQRMHQVAVFVAGIAIGIGTNFLVQGITNLTSRRGQVRST